jgi:hypothetical protein
MGSLIELNDTLKLKRNAGFPPDIREGAMYEFAIDGRRLYNLNPSRVFLVEEVDGKWNYVGHALILTQCIDTVNDKTTGRFQVTRVYPQDYVRLLNEFEPPMGRGYDPKQVSFRPT